MFYTLLNALQETLFMVFAAGFLTVLFGLPLGLLLTILKSNKSGAYKTFHTLIHLLESIPYVILIITIIPLIRLLIQITPGALGQALFAILVLSFISLPLFIGLITRALLQVPKGLIENAQAMGASPLQIIQKILLPEALTDIIKSITQMLIHLVGLSTLIGILGYGGLGQLAINSGYPSFEIQSLMASVILLASLVLIIQRSGNYIAHGTLKRV